jgi:3-oxoisoapionate kinase
VLTRVAESALRTGPTPNVIVCGGDTSSRILRGLGADSLRITANPVDNVVICTVTADFGWLDGAEFLLKGGQVGPDDLFELARKSFGTGSAEGPGPGPSPTQPT